jgi:hypothetical protein
LRALAEGREHVPGQTQPRPKRDLASEARQWWNDWYHTLGFTDVSVPRPALSNREFAKRAHLHQALFYIPEHSRAFYERFMVAVGQGTHWTVAANDREKIVWDVEPPARSEDGHPYRSAPSGTGMGYWLWVETAPVCPRLRTPWNTLISTIRLPSLPEYAVIWHAHKARTQLMLDTRSWCWLRTRYKFADGRLGALLASEYGGRVLVIRDGSENLAVSVVSGGGRAAEVVTAT